jgi:hypothetical protein
MRNTLISKLTFSENNTFRMYVMVAWFVPNLVKFGSHIDIHTDTIQRLTKVSVGYSI